MYNRRIISDFKANDNRYNQRDRRLMHRLNNIRLILLNTSHPGNVGATARAMKTMGLSELTLVGPKRFPDPEAVAMSANAVDLLNQAKVVNSLDEALVGCDLVIGASSRQRSLPWPLLSPRECGDKVMAHANVGRVAILFGNEQVGLSNDELQRCQYHVNIPANPAYCSLNLAASVQVIAYELRMSALSGHAMLQEGIDELATDKEMQDFFEHLEEALKKANVLQERCPRQMMKRMKRLFVKAHLEKSEVRLLRGVWAALMRGKE